MKENTLPPIQIVFDITDRCQMRCTTCSKWQVNQQEVISKELTTQEWKDIVFKLYSWLGEGFGVIFSGGEPFLRTDLFEIIEYAASLKIHSMVITNAFSISGLAEKIADSKIGSICVSLNSINNPLIHDRSRGRENSYQKCIEALSKINELKRQKNKNLAILISTIIMPDNMDELIPLVEFVKENKYNGILFQVLDDIDSFHAFEMKKSLNVLEYEIPAALNQKQLSMREKIIPVLDTLIEMKKTGAPVYNSKLQLETFKKYFVHPADIIDSVTCNVGSTNFLIDPYGDVRLCSNMSPVASIKENNPKDIWENSESEDCRTTIRQCKRYCRMLDCNFNKISTQKIAARVRKALIDLNRIN